MESHRKENVAKEAMENLEGKEIQDEEREEEEQQRKERNPELGTERYTSAERRERRI